MCTAPDGDDRWAGRADRIDRDYLLFEEAFVAWAHLGGVGTADLDACIWSSLSSLGLAARSLFGVDNLTDLD